MSVKDELYMRRALQLAQQGAGLVSPNPMVGCVLVYQDTVIGEGYHHQYGGPHAEVVAVSRVNDTSLLSQSTAYVTLEPCSHFGKTPPCCDLLIAKKIQRVVIANVDPNPQVQGRGIQKMQKAGIEVVSGVLEKEARRINRRFFTFHEKKRPYIILKWAHTQDGFIARKNFDSKWISGVQSRQLVHKWRAEEASILVGKNTTLHDNPGLTTRDWYGSDPVRIVLDQRRALTDELTVFSDGKPTWRVVEEHYAQEEDLAVNTEDGLQGILKLLHERNIQSVFVEGGSHTLQQFIDANLWDEARIFTGQTSFGEGIAAPRLSSAPSQQERIGEDLLDIYEN